MKIIADLHTHTIKSHTGMSTLLENIEVAKKNNISMLAVTDYGPKAKQSKEELFKYLKNIPRSVAGVTILKGVEADVMDIHSGLLDIDETESDKFDWVIAAYHKISDYDEKILSYKVLTNMFERIIENPSVNTIAHMERYACGFDIQKIISLMKENGKVVEIGVQSFLKDDTSFENKQIKNLVFACKELASPICVVSNAHIAEQINGICSVESFLNEIQYPEELIINSSEELLNDYLEKFKKLKKAKIERRNAGFRMGYAIRQ